MTKQIPGQMSLFDNIEQPKTRKKCGSCAHLRHGVTGLMEYHVYMCKGFDDCISRSSDPEQAACDRYQPKGDCKTCAYRCWLHRDGKTYQGCEHYDGCGYKKREEDQNVNSHE